MSFQNGHPHGSCIAHGPKWQLPKIPFDRKNYLFILTIVTIVYKVYYILEIHFVVKEFVHELLGGWWASPLSTAVQPHTASFPSTAEVVQVIVPNVLQGRVGAICCFYPTLPGLLSLPSSHTSLEESWYIHLSLIPSYFQWYRRVLSGAVLWVEFLGLLLTPGYTIYLLPL